MRVEELAFGVEGFEVFEFFEHLVGLFNRVDTALGAGAVGFLAVHLEVGLDVASVGDVHLKVGRFKHYSHLRPVALQEKRASAAAEFLVADENDADVEIFVFPLQAFEHEEYCRGTALYVARSGAVDYVAPDKGLSANRYGIDVNLVEKLRLGVHDEVYYLAVALDVDVVVELVEELHDMKHYPVFLARRRGYLQKLEEYLLRSLGLHLVHLIDLRRPPL